MFQSVATSLDWLGVMAFTITGALVASRKQMDVVGFIVVGTVTGIGGGTLRDVLLGLPVFWVREPAYLITCAFVSVLAFLGAHILQSRYRYLLWLDAIGLALFAVTGAEKATLAGADFTVAVTMGVITATFGGILRDLLGGESPVILTREIYASAALAGALTYVVLMATGAPREFAAGAGFAIGLLVRAAALRYGWSLPRYGQRLVFHTIRRRANRRSVLLESGSWIVPLSLSNRLKAATGSNAMAWISNRSSSPSVH